MKKFLGILVLGLLLSGKAYAGVNEPGSGPIASITDVKSNYYEKTFRDLGSGFVVERECFGAIIMI